MVAQIKTILLFAKDLEKERSTDTRCIFVQIIVYENMICPKIDFPVKLSKNMLNIIKNCLEHELHCLHRSKADVFVALLYVKIPYLRHMSASDVSRSECPNTTTFSPVS